jgi:hypothetical protein
MVDVRISGAAQLRRVAAQIRATGDKGLGREMGRAIDKALEPTKKAIDASAERTMPSGYRSVLTRSLKHRRGLRTTTRTASVRLTTSAVGEKEARDLPALEAGNLRHPVFRRSRPTKRGRKANPWAVTKVEPGFHRRGTAKTADEAEKQLRVVLDDFADRLAKG